MLNDDPLTAQIIGCAIEVHRQLGPGLLESSYQHCLAHEMQLQGVIFKAEQALPIKYKETQLNCGYRMDFVVADKVMPLQKVRNISTFLMVAKNESQIGIKNRRSKPSVRSSDPLDFNILTFCSDIIK